MADEVMLDLGVVEHVVEGEGHAAGVSEEAIDAFPEKALHQDVRAGHQVRHVGSLSGGGRQTPVCPDWTHGFALRFRPARRISTSGGELTVRTGSCINIFCLMGW